MGRKPTRKQATNHEGRNGSKESGTKRQATVRKHAAKVASQQEDDGTQIEGTQQRKPSPRRVKRKEGEKTLNEANAYNQSLRQFSLATCESGVQALADEFTKIKLMGQANIPPKTAFDANADKNRYKDVFCIDQSRVILTWPPPTEGSSDYIHANWVPIRGEKKFICTQGPIEKTVDDFWRLVWQEKTKAIVMLCGIIELGKKKCEQYWCERAGDQMKVASGITIKTIDVAEAEKNLICSKLELSVEGQDTFVCHHFLWKEWPDRGVPENFMACFRLLQRLKTYPAPTLVHCSAGIGRTGTIVGLEMANQILCAGDRLVLADVVKELRQHRHGSVQTEVQYIYMHRVLIGLAENKKIVKREEIASFYENYETYIKGKN